MVEVDQALQNTVLFLDPFMQLRKNQDLDVETFNVVLLWVCGSTLFYVVTIRMKTNLHKFCGAQFVWQYFSWNEILSFSYYLLLMCALFGEKRFKQLQWLRGRRYDLVTGCCCCCCHLVGAYENWATYYMNAF